MINNETKPNIIIALPKGRILDEIMPFFEKANIIPESAFFDKDSRLLRFKTNKSNVEIIRVRSFDVATFVAFGAAQIGVCGDDVLEEFKYSEIYSPIDFNVGKCHMAVAAPVDFNEKSEFEKIGHIRIATKYPNITMNYYQQKGIQVECVKLSGAMELAPTVGLCHRIVDVVSSGATLKANGLIELEHIMDVSAKLIVNRSFLKASPKVMKDYIDLFKSTL
ncbi:MAG: ATP phosphoribosyltransferase [Alphaproteobacteria bacterium]|nr:ATP phosphoribosyltransferase [Alphaproteobacteria bacterium]